jgi:DNA-directed RNA polymerase specialized sigma24 family protein
MRRKKYVSGLLKDLDYIEAPAVPDSDELRAIVQRYRDGELSLRNRIIRDHLHIAASLVPGGWNNADELLGEALLALVEAVDKALEALYDNEITPYITTIIRDKIKDHIARDRTVYMPARTFRDKVAKGEIRAGGNDDPAIIGVLSLNRAIKEDDYDSDGRGMDTVEFCRLSRFPYTVPLARPEVPSLEFTEALELATQTDTERRIIALRAEGNAYVEMEQIMGLKKSTIGYHVSKVEERFQALYAG